MPAKNVKSALAGKIKGNAVKSHATDETDYGRDFAELPGGVTGVAQLCDSKFDLYKAGQNQGEPYYYVAGIVVEVNEPDKQYCVGRRTSLTMPACETKTQKGKVTSQDDNIASIMNEMRKLGASTAECNDGDDLENLAGAILSAAPFFRFSTSQSDATPEFPNPRVWHNWSGTKGMEDYVPPEANGQAVKDNTASQKPQDAPAEKQTQKALPKDKEPDLDELARKADENDVPSQEKLSEMALAAGVSQDDIDGADSWGSVAEAIRSSGGGGDEGSKSSETSEAAAPEKEDVIFYKPKGARKRIECEVTAVFQSKQTVNLKNLDDGKTTYKGVPWSDLELE